MVLYLDPTAIINKIKCYLTTNGGNFLEIQCGFYRYALLTDLLWLVLLKEHLPRIQEKLQRDCFEHYFERSSKLCNWSSTQVRLFLLTGEAGIVNVQDCGMHWYLSRILS